MRLWREPVLTEQPVFILESDDWGAGPIEQADILARIMALLSEFSNEQGEYPVVTLAVILKVALCGYGDDEDISLQDDAMKCIKDSIQEGVDKKIFSIQLHGLYHYWPATIEAWEEHDASRSAWRQNCRYARTELLPAYLQSRWTNVQTLPSCEHSEQDVTNAVMEEIDLYEMIFSNKPRVVVPPTFQWTETVERAWMKYGIDTIITPGCRYTLRDKDGKLIEEKQYPVYNGLKGTHDLVYLVRDVYFEPARGHLPEHVLDEVKRRHRLRRPALVEMHRDNFLDAPDASLVKLSELMRNLLTEYPGVRFISSESLAHSIRSNNPVFVETRWSIRFFYFIRRLHADFSLRHVAKLTGLSTNFGLSST